MNGDNEYDPFATQPSQPGFIAPDGAPRMSSSQPGMGDFVPIPPSPYGYGAPVQPGSSQKNYLGILALIFPFVSLSLVGIIMGHMGLAAVKRGTANNHGVALAGTIISWVFTILIVPGILAAIAIPIYLDQQQVVEESVVDPGTDTAPAGAVVTFSALVLGDCIADPYDNLVEEVDGTSWIEGVVRADCSQAHYGEVYQVGSVEADAYVEDDIYAQADELCYFAFEDYMGVAYEDSVYYYEPYYPTALSWKFGDRETTCVVTSLESDTVGTLRGSGR